MDFFQIFNSPLTIVFSFFMAIAAAYLTIQKFIQYELEVDRRSRFHALKEIIGALAFLGTFIVFAFLISFFT